MPFAFRLPPYGGGRGERPWVFSMNKLSNSPAARWTALTIVSVTMMFGYFFTDVMSPLEPLLTASKGTENVLASDGHQANTDGSQAHTA